MQKKACQYCGQKFDPRGAKAHEKRFCSRRPEMSGPISVPGNKVKQEFSKVGLEVLLEDLDQAKDHIEDLVEKTKTEIRELEIEIDDRKQYVARLKKLADALASELTLADLEAAS